MCHLNLFFIFYFVVDGISTFAEVRVDSTLHNLALNSDELTLSVCAVSGEAALFVSFYDVRTFVNQVNSCMRRLNKNTISRLMLFFGQTHLCLKELEK